LWRGCNPKVGRFTTEVDRHGIIIKPPAISCFQQCCRSALRAQAVAQW
jgi:hypothetical protein